MQINRKTQLYRKFKTVREVDVMVRNTANSKIHDKTDQKPNLKIVESDVRRVCKYQRGIQNPYIENEQHLGQHKMYKRTNNNLQNIYIKLKITTSGTHRVTNPVTSHE